MQKRANNLEPSERCMYLAEKRVPCTRDLVSKQSGNAGIVIVSQSLFRFRLTSKKGRSEGAKHYPYSIVCQSL